jgi:hypothetical protein
MLAEEKTTKTKILDQANRFARKIVFFHFSYHVSVNPLFVMIGASVLGRGFGPYIKVQRGVRTGFAGSVVVCRRVFGFC